MSLTPEQQCVRLAEWEGWKDIRQLSDREEGIWVGTHPPIENWHKDGRPYAFQGQGPIPEYHRDLNALHRVEERLTDEEWRRYRRCLRGMQVDSSSLPDWADIEDCLIHATAAQRLESILRALNLWEEEVQG